MKESKEIERKFLLSPLTRTHIIINGKHTYTMHSVRIHQVYLNGIRFRQVMNTITNECKYFMTVKSDSRGPIERNEWETEIPEWVYVHLVTGDYLHLTKLRYSWDNENMHFDFDRFIEPSGLEIIEVEFKTVEEALAFDPQIQFPEGKFTEVTYDSKYTNYELAKWYKEHK